MSPEAVDPILEFALPGWRLDATRRPSRIWLGGRPKLAADETWPLNARGVPMTFLAQVDTSALPVVHEDWRPVVGLPAGHHVFRVFADLLDCPHDPGPAVVLATSEIDSLRVQPAPPIPDPLPSGGPFDGLEMVDRFWDLRQRFCSAKPMVTLPSDLSGVFSDPAVDTYDIANQVWGTYGDLEPWHLDNFFGHTFEFGSDPRVVPQGEVLSEWRAFITIHSRPTQEILDEGAFCVHVRAADLQNGARSIHGYCDLQYS